MLYRDTRVVTKWWNKKQRNWVMIDWWLIDRLRDSLLDHDKLTKLIYNYKWCSSPSSKRLVRNSMTFSTGHWMRPIFLPLHQLHHLRQADSQWPVVPDLLTLRIRSEALCEIPFVNFFLILSKPPTLEFDFLIKDGQC